MSGRSSPAGSIFSGVGSGKPVARELSSGMFGSVPDAFDGKSLKIGELTPNSRRKQLELAKIQELDLNEQFYTDVSTNGQSKSNTDQETSSQTEQLVKSNGIPSSSDNDHQSTEGRVVIRGGCVVNADQTCTADVYIDGGVIKQIGPNLDVPADARTIDAQNKLVIPGGIDTRTHFGFAYPNGLKSVDDFKSGTKSALAGGTTMIVDVVEPSSDESLIDAYDARQTAASSESCCDYAISVALCKYDDKIEADMDTLAKEKGVSSFVMKMTSPDLNTGNLYKVFKRCAKLGAVAQVQAENASIKQIKAQELIDQGITGPEGALLCSPEESEYTAVRQAIALSDAASCALYVTKLCSPAAAEAVADARHQGKVVFGETLSSVVGTNGTELFHKDWRHAAGYVSSPPLRSEDGVQQHMVDLLATNDLQTVASAHLTFNADQKAAGVKDFRMIPAGVNGVEDRMSVLWQHAVASGKMTPSQFVAASSSNAAKIFNIYPQKGRIAVGSDADVVVLNTECAREISAKTHKQNCDFNIFEGQTCHGVPDYVIRGGKVVVDSEGLHAVEGEGRLIATACNGEFAYARLRGRDKAQALSPIERDPYEGKVSTAPEPTANHIRSDNPIMPAHPDTFYGRPNTQAGGRNMQESSFSLSGAQYDEKKNKSCGYRISNPPGGRSSGSLW